MIVTARAAPSIVHVDREPLVANLERKRNDRCFESEARQPDGCRGVHAPWELG